MTPCWLFTLDLLELQVPFCLIRTVAVCDASSYTPGAFPPVPLHAACIKECSVVPTVYPFQLITECALLYIHKTDS